MTSITLQIERKDDLNLLPNLIHRLNLRFVQHPEKTPQEPPPAEQEKMIDYILSYQNNQPSFGDAATWQRSERTEHGSPWEL